MGPFCSVELRLPTLSPTYRYEGSRIGNQAAYSRAATCMIVYAVGSLVALRKQSEGLDRS